MIRKRNLCFGLLLLFAAGGCLHSCRQDAFEETLPGREPLLAQGRYLTARSGEASIADNPDAKPFAIGTPYRLLAFTKPYDPEQPDDATPAAYPRFNKVAWEGETSGGLHYIGLDRPDYWFGFAAIGDEPANKLAGGLVSLDFYGFTYGKAENPQAGYIELDAPTGETTPAEGSLASLTRTERVNDDGTLNDLLRGELFNQNIATAGKEASAATQSILPFKHSFSKLQFYVVQQPAETPDENGDPLPCFPGLRLEKVEVTGTYLEGSVYLQDGKVKLPDVDPATRPLAFDEQYEGDVTPKEVAIGEMLVFPSDGAALKNADKADGYSVGLDITVSSPNRRDIERFLANTESPGEVEEVTAADGTSYYRGTVVEKSIIDYDPATGKKTELRFKQNTCYRLVIWFQKDAVRIITVIPQVEEWLPGEGTEENPWQEQALGQPQMFDNIVWSDRNLGADHYDPATDFEKTIGYFYQSGRNIPYYPFDTKEYYTFSGNQAFRIPGKEFPAPEDANKSILADVESAEFSKYMFYPIVDKEIINIYNTDKQQWWGGARNSWIWSINTDKSADHNKEVQLFIPEKKTENFYFDFVKQNNEKPTPENHGLTPEQDMHWELKPQNQPTAGAWIVPSSDDFMSIFPSTPHAGNITFRGGGDNSQPMIGWGTSWISEIPSNIETLRVTVPFYEPNTKETKENEAWKILAKYENEEEDKGSTHIEAYIRSPKWGNNLNYEPKGDPEEGFASVYVISRKGEDNNSLPPNLRELKNNGKDKYCIKSWGTIYAIKRVYTPQAYRMRWRVICKTYGTNQDAAGMYVEICRYRCNATDHLNEKNFMTYDWDHPAATIYFPICGLGDWNGQYINFGTECQYATSDKIENSLTGALQMKITGADPSNAYIAIVKNVMNRNFAKQIRPIGGGYNE